MKTISKFLIILMASVLGFGEVLASYKVEGLHEGSLELIKDGADKPEEQAVTNFGVVANGSSVTKEYRITNESLEVPLLVDSVDIVGSSNFTTSFPGEVQIDPGLTANFAIEFEAGTKTETAVVEIKTDAEEELEVYTFSVIGEGDPQTYYVDSSATGANNGSSWSNAFVHLQDAIGASFEGDQVRVATGVYYPDEGVGRTDNERLSSFRIPVGVSVFGGYPTGGGVRDPSANVTILSGDLDQNDPNDDGNHVAEDPSLLVGLNSHHVVSLASGSLRGSMLSGFTITAGLADNFPQLVITGAGIYLGGGTVDFQLDQCHVVGNQSLRTGTGVHILGSPDARLTVTDCMITDNLGTEDGLGGTGLYFRGNVLTMRDSIFQRNSVILTINGAFRGIALRYQGTGVNPSAVITDCEFSDQKKRGTLGSLSVVAITDTDLATIERCRFFDNDVPTSSVESFAGSLLFERVGTADINDSLFHGNRGSVIKLGQNLDVPVDVNLANTTIAGNDGQSIDRGPTHLEGVVSLKNCAIIGNGGLDPDVSTEMTLLRSHSLVEGFAADGDGNIADSVDPGFVAPIDLTAAPTDAGEYQLRSTSALIETGLNTLTTSSIDLAGNPRFFDADNDFTATVDIGAYEFQTIVMELPMVEITGIDYNPINGEVTLTVETSAATTFLVQRVQDLQPSNWTSMFTGSLSAGTNQVTIEADQYGGQTGRMFFRLVSPSTGGG